jgi:hypothetical protein
MLIANRVLEYPIEHFFGYYDKSPWNNTGRYILTIQVPLSGRHPLPNEVAIVGYVDTEDSNKFFPIDKTKTWNLQQGCMLQWLGPNFSDKVIYNDELNGKYVSCIYNITTNKKRILERPIYSVSKDGKWALSLNFSRLHRLRPGYGYSNLVDNTEGILYPENDGIWLLDIEKNISRLIISVADIVKIGWNNTMDSVEHKFNHLEISPDGKRFMFLHRWKKNNIRYSRLFTANLDGTEIYCVADDQMVSHSCWKNNNQILSWARKEGFGDNYYLFTDKSEKFEIIGKGILNEDGHPSYSPDGRYILTDTYPDKTRMRSLIIYDTYTNKKYVLGKYFAPFKYDEEVRCDLHPRWNRNGSKICFDSVHDGKRGQYIINNPLFISKERLE